MPIWRTKGQYRKKAKRRINRLRANYRSKNESINSVIKRVYGSTVRSIKVSMQNKEVLFKEVAYNAERSLASLAYILRMYTKPKIGVLQMSLL